MCVKQVSIIFSILFKAVGEPQGKVLGRSSTITYKPPGYTQLEMTKIAHSWDCAKDWGKEWEGKDRKVPGV